MLPRFEMRVIREPVIKPVNTILATLSLMFPKFSPIFEAGRLILSNRKFFLPFLKVIFSNKSNEEKIKTLQRDLQRKVKQEVISEFSEKSSRMISQLLQEQIGFFAMAKEMNKIFGETDAKIFQSFFEDTFKKSIEESALRVFS